MPFWEKLTKQEWARINALPFEAACSALLDAEPRASANDLVTLNWATPHARAEFRKARAAWRAARDMGRTAEDDALEVDKVPVREVLITQLHEALNVRDTTRTNQILTALLKVAAVGATDRKDQASDEDWTRLSDRESGTLVALIRKLNGEEATETDEKFLEILK